MKLHSIADRGLQWHNQRRTDYVIAEASLSTRWKKQILARRSRADIQKDALNDKDLRSIVEAAFLSDEASKS